MLETGFARIRGRLRRPLPLLKYIVLSIETHAFCAALAFFALIAVYPLSMLLLTVSKFVLQWPPAVSVIREGMLAYHPAGRQFVHNLDASVQAYGEQMQITAMVWILLGAAGFFIPLETAFNRLWGFPDQRAYWKNQLVGLLLTIGCVGLAVLMVIMTGGLHWAVENFVPFRFLKNAINFITLKVAALTLFVTAIFLFYKFLPNGKIRAADVLPAALIAGLVSEVVRIAFALLLPGMQLEKTQGPYRFSISFVILAYFESFVVLGGAFLAAPAPPGVTTDAARPGAGTAGTPPAPPGRT
jgi:uncharacterized BrkB/YihY/UPF0761 family membrane protein